MSDEVILENYQIQMMAKFHTKGKNRFIITHNRGNGVTTAIVWYIINRMRLTGNTNVLLINGNSSTKVAEIFKRIRQAFAGEIGLDDPYCIKLKNGSSLRSDKYIVDGCTYDIIYCDGKPDGTMWIEEKLYQQFLKRDGKFITSRILHNNERHPSSDEYWSNEEYRVFTNNDDTLPMFVPYWMPSWKNKYGVKLRKVGRLDAMCYNYDDIMKYVEKGYYVDANNIDEFYISNNWILNEFKKNHGDSFVSDKDKNLMPLNETESIKELNDINENKINKSISKMGKVKNINENNLTTEEITKAAFKKFEDWKKNQKYKKLYRSMSLEELKDKVLQLNVEKNDFREFLKEKGHSKVEYKFYEYVIMELDKYIKYYMDEIKTIEKIENYITDKGFDVVRVMCSKEFNDLLNEKSNRLSEVPFEFKLIECINNGLKKLGYTDDEIDALYGISSSDDADSTVEASNFVDEDYGKCSDISQNIKDGEYSNALMGVDGDDLDEEECDVKYDIDDPTSYMKDVDSTDYYKVPLTGDIADWGGITTSASTIQQKVISKNNFEAYFVIDGVDYSNYVDSVTADYMERELMIEIVDEDNGAIPKLVNYWEELYSCDNEVDNGDIIVRTNTCGNKSFETFKDCAIIDFKCSSYVNEDFPRRANLVFSFGKSVTEYCAE